jgi:hypothetical protein
MTFSVLEIWIHRIVRLDSLKGPANQICRHHLELQWIASRSLQGPRHEPSVYFDNAENEDLKKGSKCDETERQMARLAPHLESPTKLFSWSSKTT